MKNTHSIGHDVAEAGACLRLNVNRLRFAAPVSHVYNPFDYAWPVFEAYCRKFAGGKKRVVFFGMNPGPWGMAQTGVPFGEISAVRNWMELDGRVAKPEREHAKRPIEGFDCLRSEVSGKRLWGLFADRFGEPEHFFRENFVTNYCPLVFMEESGRNRTPDKLPAAERTPLLKACDAHLKRVVELLDPDWVIGVGAFAEKSARRALESPPLKIGTILHPSPASPAANRGWAEAATRQLEDLGVW